MMKFAFSVGLLLVSTPLAASKAFLDNSMGSEMDMSDMLAFLLSSEESADAAANLSSAVRDQHGKDSHAKHQAVLQPMFKSLPKNEKGNLGLPAARYALHRLFEQRHRWNVRGLSPNAASKDKGSSHLVHKAMQFLTAGDKTGLTLPGLAAIAGTLEQLITKEAAARLASFFERDGFSAEDSVISADTLTQIVESYMIIYISGADFRKNAKQDVMDDNKFMSENTREWKETKEWVKSTMMQAAKTEGGCKDKIWDCRFGFDATTRVLKAVLEKYGFFNDRQCHEIKTKLLEVQERGSGRVTLAAFYKAGQSGAWEFNEKVDYLRSLGALDESTKDNPKVIVANYVSSWVNCLTPSKFYAVCCRNECEDHMKVIEKHFSGAMADPDDIIRLVETHSFFTVTAPPNLAALRHRLVSVAERHRGKVPIHGRLFAQWMHHAFPSSCPYPHESGTTNPQTPDEWMMETGHKDIKASDAQIKNVMTKSTISVGGDGVSQGEPIQAGELPWSDTEELLVVRPEPQQEEGQTFVEKMIGLMEVVMVAALVCVVIWMASEQRKARKLSHKCRL